MNYDWSKKQWNFTGETAAHINYGKPKNSEQEID